MKTMKEILADLASIEERAIQPEPPKNATIKPEREAQNKTSKSEKNQRIAIQQAQARKAQLELQKQQIDVNLARSKK
jgi:hypothetical protein